MKQHVIRVTLTAYIAYDPDLRGDTGRAEDIEQRLKAELDETPGLIVEDFKAKKCKVDAE